MSREFQKQRSGQVKQEIIETALAIALEEGFENLSVRKLSSRMNYTTGVIYHHFKDKQDIIDAIQEKESLKIRSLIESSLLPEEGLATNLRSVFHSICQLAYRQPQEYNLVVLQRHKVGEKNRPEMLSLLVSLLEKDHRLQPKPAEEKQNLAFAIWSSFLGFHLNISKLSHSISPQKLELLFDMQMNLILKGVLGI